MVNGECDSVAPSAHRRLKFVGGPVPSVTEPPRPRRSEMWMPWRLLPLQSPQRERAAGGMCIRLRAHGTLIYSARTPTLAPPLLPCCAFSSHPGPVLSFSGRVPGSCLPPRPRITLLPEAGDPLSESRRKYSMPEIPLWYCSHEPAVVDDRNPLGSHGPILSKSSE